MIKIVLALYAVAAVLKAFAIAFRKNAHLLFHRKTPPLVQTTSVSGSWYGICEKRGTKGGLHRFEGNRYCAKCYAWLAAEKTYGKKNGEKGEHGGERDA